MWPFRSKNSDEYCSEQFQLEEDTFVLEASSEQRNETQKHVNLLPSKGSEIPHGALREYSSNTSRVKPQRTSVGSLRIICGVVVLLFLNAAITILISVFVVPHIDCVSMFPPFMSKFCPGSTTTPPGRSYSPMASEQCSCVSSPPPQNLFPIRPPQVVIIPTPTFNAPKPLEPTSPLRNFASSADGAKPLSELCLGTDGALWNFALRHLPHTIRAGSCGSAYLALVGGQRCWEFVGKRSQVGIRLSDWTGILRIGIESGRTVEESPREVHVWGMLDGVENRRRFSEAPEEVITTIMSRNSGRYLPPSLYDYKFVLLAALTYSLDDPPSQEFTVFPEFDDLGVTFGVVVVQVLSNWGGPSTSVCRIDILGT